MEKEIFELLFIQSYKVDNERSVHDFQITEHITHNPLIIERQRKHKKIDDSTVEHTHGHNKILET